MLKKMKDALKKFYPQILFVSNVMIKNVYNVKIILIKIKLLISANVITGMIMNLLKDHVKKKNAQRLRVKDARKENAKFAKNIVL